ncbi:molybdopterin molybdenumtransferase MoeA, partial [Streptomyces sp. NPDC003514]
MTPGGTRAGQDAEDLDIEEVLALVNEGHGPSAHGDSVPAPTPRPHGSGRSGRAAEDGHHRATPWPDARETA